MKLFIGLIILSAFTEAFSQIEVVFDTTALLPRTESCDKARIKASSDEQSKILRISQGTIFGDEYKYERFYSNYMVTKFGIEVVKTGCLISNFEECYNDQMRKIIKVKYGNDFFVNTENEIREEFEVFKKLEQGQKKEYINFDFTYKIVDQKADFALGQENFIKELHNRIDFSKINFSGKVIGLNLIIGREGSVDKCEVLSKNLQKEDSERIVNAIKEIGRWIPVRLYGFNVKSEKIIGIPSR